MQKERATQRRHSAESIDAQPPIPAVDAANVPPRGALVQWSERLVGALNSLSSSILFLMMAFMVVDVIGRKAFNRPLVGSVELVELCLLVSVYAAVPLVSASRVHVRIELLDSVIPLALRSLRGRISELFCGLVLLGCAWLVSERAISTYRAEDATSLLRIGFWPFYAVVAVLLAVDAIIHVALAFQRGGDKQP